MEMHYPIIHESNEGTYHFIHGFRLYLEEQLRIRIKATKLWGDIHFSKEEMSWMSMIHQHFTGQDTPFWLICTGGKRDYTAKWWIPEFAQKVVNHFRNRIQFVQFGMDGPNHEHPPLKGVINLVGKTDIRMFMRIMYHASGVICPVTFAMHLAAAMPAKPGLPVRKACIVTAGGREPCLFTAYTNHIFLHSNGQMQCCDNGGCWKSRTVALKDGDEKDESLCNNTVQFHGRKVQRCMHDLVTAADVINAIERYHDGGILNYLPLGSKTINAKWSDRITK
jgi:ADP-heptose:LPS heptosyltransferase